MICFLVALACLLIGIAIGMLLPYAILEGIIKLFWKQ